ncbi:hypothetical protein HFU84_09320 [Acidithiobacillus sp. CV18-2]|uniref:Type II secretion system protein GspE N-terminal domain-containing protein n=1 Tax=Igneacidithiobacillus copahuensis TaxID=2724909 RepID=A0AAE2YSC1_9PROT|nr:hypothetical protein [Acidithiobacillus sp. CV18-3]MBU2758122.1 hypothetical protein [Acidithiobacillus sp. BN09-2]MBU2777700.1 hypothetical protein [Acidithiobacillus sp. CV18-2]MBU2789355.1 hypothetical protein [Igneacidithiobacillus copahuensis]MBU2797058.1 hypothetical protein [Acidithiobacillus sp. VAN18-2]MBU2798386.1 hypothetical protein [Acidithiobacillus sp. VAN18-4]
MQLQELSARYDWPTVEYDESLTASAAILRRLNVDSLRDELWLPIRWDDDSAEVIVCNPEDPQLVEHIRSSLGVRELCFRVATPSDLVRLIENSADLNEHFPVYAGRTPLAKVRTYLAGLRTRYSAQRTQFARSRTGLALARTGLTFITIAVAFFRLFGTGDLLIFEIPLLIIGLFAIVDGLLWYFPARKESRRIKSYPPYPVPEGYTAINMVDPGGAMEFSRSAIVPGSTALRQNWDALSPVERRRFLANDRTNLAEERTILAYLRVMMAKARTGLAFARTGVAFAGVGIGFIRKFPAGPWSIFDWSLVVIGVLMLIEGFLWYGPGRRAANKALAAVAEKRDVAGLWDTIFPSLCLYAQGIDPVAEANSPQAQPGVFATTGLALERTTLADKRNTMSRLRTIMARARTGMAFIRTGFSVMTVGTGLFVYFHFTGHVHVFWSIFDIALVIAGLYLIADGLHWYLPAERVKRRSRYVDNDFEIADADYSLPRSAWKRELYRE